MNKIRFSNYFNLNKTQSELDFIDIYIDDDMPLFIDPYIFKVRNDLFSISCSDLIIDFFETVVFALKNNDEKFAHYLLGKLSEPKETHLGVGRYSYSGRGVGGKQADDLFEKLSNSKAIKTGHLTDISDCELMIPGIGFDKISDMTTNIIRSELIKYTQEQCELHGIPMKNIPSGRTWNPIEKRWSNGEYTLQPVVNNKILLVPKCVVVSKPILSSAEFYNHDILEFIQSEHIYAHTSLVELLKNGKKRVTKKKLKELPEYAMSKEFIYSFCNKHPEIISNYKERKGKSVIKMGDFDDIDEAYIANELIAGLKKINTGSESASAFHNISIGILEFLFFPHLIYPKKEHEVHEGRKRIDITFQNASNIGFWNIIRTNPKISASIIMFECKNYTNDIKNPELDQMSGRFSNNRGWFGIVLTRHFENKDLFLKRCQDTAQDGRGIIICLDDTDINFMLNKIKDGKRSQINEFLFKKYSDVIS